MASLGSLVVSLAMDTAKFTGDVGKAAQQMARLTAEAGKIGAAIGASVGLGLNAIGRLVKQSIDSADEMSKLAASVGVTTEEISRLSYAARLADVSQEQLGKGLAHLAGLAADAAAGGKSASDMFAAMGLSVKGTNGELKPTSQVLSEIAEKFKTYRDGTEKTALASALLGEKLGPRFVNLLNQGAAGLRELGIEADTLGVTMSQKTGKAAEQFNDNLTRLQAAKEGLGRQIAERLLPTLEAMTDRMFDGAKNADLFGRAAAIAAAGVKILVTGGAILVGVFATIGTAVGGALAAIVTALSGRFLEAWDIARGTVVDFAGNIRATAGTVATIWDDAAGKVAGKAEAIGGQIAAPLVLGAEKIRKQGHAIKAEIDKVEQRLAGLKFDVDMQGLSEGVKQRIKGLQDLVKQGAKPEQVQRYMDLTAAQQRFTVATEAAAEAQRKHDDMMSEAAALTNSLMTPLEQLLAQYERQNALLAAGAINAQTYARAVAKSQEDFAKATEQAVKTSDTFAQRAAQNIQDFLGNTLQNAMEGNFSNIARSFTSMINRMVAEALAADLARSLFGDSLKGGSGGGLIASAASFIGRMFGGKAAGGPVSPGRGYLVGERGPEMFVPTTAGTVQPAAAMQGGNTYVVHVTATPGMSRQTAMQQGEQIGRGIQRATARNG